MLTNCLEEHNGNCIPIGVERCEVCANYKFDPQSCGNYQTSACLINKGICPCKNRIKNA